MTPRPLRYHYLRSEGGRPRIDGTGEKTVLGKDEKGVDVLCALAIVREALLPEGDLVILASQDSDLEPALDEGIRLSTAKIETFCWFDPTQPHRTRRLRPGGGRTLWNTRLTETEFRKCWDLTENS